MMFLLALLLGCAPEADACRDDPPLTWETFGEGFLRTHCTGCHSSLVPQNHRNGAPVRIDLDTYEDVLLWADKVEEQMDPDAPRMPPGGGPTEEEYAMFQEWVDCEVLPDANRYWFGD